MTEEVFRQDAYATECAAQVVAVDAGSVVLDRTVFYPMGGGQPGDSGVLVLASGVALTVTDTRKGAEGIVHVLAEGSPTPVVGDAVTARIDWQRRHLHMRIHTALHLLCAVVPAGVTGGQIGAGRGRLDFDVGETTLDKAAIEAGVNALIAADHPVTPRWVDEAELDAKPDLVRTMSVQPPRGTGRLRLLEIPGVDLQPCGGTHVRHTGEIGPLVVEKIENKGKRNRRVAIALAELASA
ncbi:MAG: alanyl-tRNA editing protein [Alphaproteobacteria bacterium]|nr:MAG: alanyl-tRNA editing protein [Alphaproteobacteria bacterium]